MIGLGSMGFPGTFNGLRVIVSEHAYEIVPIFPDKPRTKRRLRRTKAKFGRTDRMNPLAYRTRQGLIVHPKIHAQLLREHRAGAAI